MRVVAGLVSLRCVLRIYAGLYHNQVLPSYSSNPLKHSRNFFTTCFKIK
jgi:hypothetical protein